MTEMQPRNATIKLSEYQPHPRNYNRHPAAQVERIAHSLATFGQVRSIVVWRGYLLAGHGVAEAAKALGWGELRADVLPDEYPEHLALAYVAADNELSRLSDPDLAQLASILDEAKQTDEELLRAIGYDDDEFEQLLREVETDAVGDNAGADTEPEIDKAEELRQKWGVETGQLWQLGEHRLICGDCTDAEVVERVMGGEKAQLAWFDPPFGIDLQPQRQKTQPIENDGREQAQILWANFLPILNKHMSPDTNLFLCQDWTEFEWTLPLVRQYFTIKSKIVWNKNVWGIGYYTRPKHEDILYCWKGTPPTIDEPVADVWDVARENAPVHAAEKPPGLSEIAIKHFCASGDLVTDWFSGVGTTIIAFENLKRRCRAVEISPGYVAVALERWHQHTGKMPELLT